MKEFRLIDMFDFESLTDMYQFIMNLNNSYEKVSIQSMNSTVKYKFNSIHGVIIFADGKQITNILKV